MSKIIKCSKRKACFVETDASMKILGRKFTSGGAFIAKRRDTGKLGGILYAYPNDNAVGSWDGKMKIPANFDREYYSNMGDKRQTIRFYHDGKRFIGTWFKDRSDVVRVKEIGKLKKVV